MHEFDIAFHQYLCVLRKKRLIVVVMMDDPLATIASICNRERSTENSLDFDSLHQYLSRYTYIDFKADDWFDKLLYALPVNGMLSTQTQQQQQQQHQNPIEHMTTQVRDEDSTSLLPEV